VSNFNVQYLEETCQQKRVKFVAILFRYWNVAVDPDSAIVSPLIFVIAAVRVFYCARSGYFWGLIAAMAALFWFIGLEQIPVVI